MTRKGPPPVVIETAEGGQHVARYTTSVFRFLFSDGDTLDVSAARDDSDLRAAVLRFAGTDVTIEGVAKLPRPKGDD